MSPSFTAVLVSRPVDAANSDDFISDILSYLACSGVHKAMFIHLLGSTIVDSIRGNVTGR